MPHRQNLLDLLAEYRLDQPRESACAGRFARFVERNPRCFERDLEPGHVTGSAWLVSPDNQRVLLTHHRKLDAWMQLGGHADGDPDIFRVARREAREESGIEALELVWPRIFDLDIHLIPARQGSDGAPEPEHLHYDVRIAFRAGEERFVVSGEAHQLLWQPIADLGGLAVDVSVERMAKKWSESLLFSPGVDFRHPRSSSTQ